MSWAYGLLEENKELKLVEVYNFKGIKKYTGSEIGFAPIKWTEIKTKKDVEYILEDLRSQLESALKDKSYRFRLKKNKRVCKNAV